MKHLRNFYSSPYVLSLIPFIVISLLVQNGIKKYSLEIVSSITVSKDSYVWFEDLDNDGSSEKIVAVNQPTSTGLAFSNVNGIINHFGFNGNFNFVSKSCLFITGDKDDNGTKEIYAFTLAGDSIFLHIIDDYKDSSIPVRNHFIATTGPGMKSPDPFIIPAEMEDLDGDGIKELIFGIGSGYSEYPRRVYSYYIHKDSLVTSPESSYFIWRILQADINGDGKREIIPYGYATTNISPEKAVYHDFSSFLIVLDQNLRFLFPPLEFPGRYSKVTPFTINKGDENSLGILYNQASGLVKSIIYFVTPGGMLSDSIQLPFHAINCLNTSLSGNENLYLLEIPRDKLGLFNASFQQLKILKLADDIRVIQMDIDLDGKDEILIALPEEGKIYIFREGLNNPVSAQVTFEGYNSDIITLKIDGNETPLISVQSGPKQYMLKYRKNPGYPYYLFFYPGIYLAILAFALTIKSIQKNQLKKKYDNENKIAQLQLALIKSQLDPHFTLNAINSIIYSLEYTDRRVAGDQLRRFANLYRNLLLSATSVQWSLGEELDFCSDYLVLEKMRFGEKIDYRITCPDNVKKTTLVPKLFIQIHVENAIKHGLSLLDSEGLVTINLNKINGILSVEITDNGVGRQKSKSQKRITTSKGLEIISELYSIYNKYYDEKISYELIDLYHNGSAAGTKVNIRIINVDGVK